MGKVTRLRPKRHDVIVEALQLVLDFGDHYELDQHTKDGLAAAVGKLAPPEKWGFVMLNPDQQRAVLKAIGAGPRPNETLKVWNACISFIAYDRDGEIMARRTQIAEAADLTPQNASTALSRLVELGVLERIRRGRYRVNPHVAWSGPLHKREIAAKEQAPVPAGAPKLRVVPLRPTP
jgi:DNA-binding transcriptional ArsR family regulator